MGRSHPNPQSLPRCKWLSLLAVALLAGPGESRLAADEPQRLGVATTTKPAQPETPPATAATAGPVFDEPPLRERYPEDIDIAVPAIADDPEVEWDYPIVYVRAPRAGDETHKRFYTDFAHPLTIQPGADLMLLHPDGREERLVEGGDGSITDPVVSFDGAWVYYVHLHDMTKASPWNPPAAGADIYKIHLETRRIVQLTNQRFTPNTGAAPWSPTFRRHASGGTHYDYGVYNMGPHPLPGGRIVFTSNRDGFRPARGYPAVALQLFVMDDRDHSIGEDEDPTNLEKIGHLNISGALHPVVLADGRIMYSSLESEAARNQILWGIWTIHPDGTNWAPLVSAFDPGGAPNGFHFQTQLSDGSIIVEKYYNLNNSGFGAYIKLPPQPPSGEPAFGPAWMQDPRNRPWRASRHYNAKPQLYRKPFMPNGAIALTPFTHGREGPAGRAVLDDPDSPHVGKFTHPSGAPDNHLLTVYSPGPVNHQYEYLPQLNGGLYLIKDGQVVTEPAQMRLIKQDPEFNAQWPRAVVPYERIYGIPEPVDLPRQANDGAYDSLPEGSPFGLVGSSSFLKRETYPNGVVPPGEIASRYAGGNDPWLGLDAFTSHGNGMPLNWNNQGGEVGLYTDDDIHAVRILIQEPTTDRQRGPFSGRRFYNHATERYRVLGEIPLRKFRDGQQPLDPDGKPDTSFLAKLPADTAFTFQTLDAEGRVLNFAQTWHQLRPGEARYDCGGCHAHSQPPTPFEQTAAAQPDYEVWDLVNKTPLLVSKDRDESRQQWNADDNAGLTFAEPTATTVEYFRDVLPILKRSCIECHSSADGKTPAERLDLDADSTWVDVPNQGRFPGTYTRLALDEKAQFGHPPPAWNSWGYPNASRYIRKFQSRRSLLVWKIYGQRLDGFSNDDHPSESRPGAGDLVHRGEAVDLQKHRAKFDIDYVGDPMPPPAAVEAGRVAPLSDEDRRTLVRWIDLGCPIDLDAEDGPPGSGPGYGWFLDDNRPVVALTEPQPGDQPRLGRVLVGLYDYDSGVDFASVEITADRRLGKHPAGTNLAQQFVRQDQAVYAWNFDEPVTQLERTTLTVRVRDHQGNTTTVRRTFSVGQAAPQASD